MLKGVQPCPTLSVSGALMRLRYYQLPLTFAEATTYLRGLWNSTQLLSLYRHYFPAEFSASTASASLWAQTHDKGNSGMVKGCLYSPKELEFVRLVDEKLFPLYVDYYLEEIEERCDIIYIPSFGIDWWQTDISDLESGWQLLLLLADHAQVELSWNDAEGGLELKELLAEVKDHKLNWDKFKALSQAAGEPLCYLPLALDMLEHNTNNIFLDPTDEIPAEPLEWCIEDIDYLTEEYRETTTISENAQKVVDWLAASPFHFKEVLELWKQALS